MKLISKNNQHFWLFIIVLIFLLNFIYLFGFQGLKSFEYQFYDYVQNNIAKSYQKEKTDAQKRIVIVGINDEDLQEFPSTIPDDNTLAELITKINEQNPAVIGLDIIRDLPVGEGIERLEKVFKETDNLYGIAKFTGIEGDKYFKSFSPSPILSAEGRIGDASVILDQDTIIRRGNLFPVVGDNPQPSFGLVLTQHYLENLGYKSNITNQGYWQFGEVVFPRFQQNDGGYVNADDSGYQILMNWYHPPQCLPIVSLTDVLTDKIDGDFFTDKIVLIGYTTITLKQDIFTTPLRDKYDGTPKKTFGVEIYGNLIDYFIGTVIDNQPVLSAVPQWLETLIISLLIILTAFLILSIEHLKSPIIFIILGLLIPVILSFTYFYLNYHLFIRGWWLPIFPIGAIIFTGVSSLIYLLGRKINNHINNLEQEIQLKTQDLSHKNEELNDKNQQLKEKIELINLQQKQLINQEKLAFLGRLTAGFCHQFKNPFYITKYNIDLGIKLLESYDLDEDFIRFQQGLKDAQMSMEQLELLSKLILISPTQKKLLFINATPNDFVENIMVSAVRFRSLEKHSSLQNQVLMEKDENLETKTNIPQQLEIAIFNVIDNAIGAILSREAREDNFEGLITVTTINQSDYWEIIVEDNGGGIAPEIKEKLFEPFVTSKPDTDGIGLGLWISQEMMTNYIKGEISVESDHENTIFCLKIPFFSR